jgi:DnaJ like chaperone protein
MNDRTVHLVKKVPVFENIKRKLHWYEVLEIKPDSSYEEIKAAYRKLMKEYHPDKVATLGKDLKALAESKTKEISEAYETAIKMKNEFK